VKFLVAANAAKIYHQVFAIANAATISISSALVCTFHNKVAEYDSQGRRKKGHQRFPQIAWWVRTVSSYGREAF
jgi:hypothetical protein